MKKLYILLILSLFLLPLVYAATDTAQVSDTFKLNTIVNYAKPCINNYTYCSSDAKCNFTVYNPDNTIKIPNLQGTNNVYSHNITITVTYIGIYKVDMICTDNNLNGAETYYFEVTGSGQNDSLGFYIIILVISFGIVIFGFWINDGWVTMLGSFGLYFLSFYILEYGIVGIKDLITTWAIGIILLGIAMYISIRSGYELIND